MHSICVVPDDPWARRSAIRIGCRLNSDPSVQNTTANPHSQLGHRDVTKGKSRLLRKAACSRSWPKVRIPISPASRVHSGVESKLARGEAMYRRTSRTDSASSIMQCTARIAASCNKTSNAMDIVRPNSKCFNPKSDLCVVYRATGRSPQTCCLSTPSAPEPPARPAFRSCIAAGRQLCEPSRLGQWNARPHISRLNATNIPWTVVQAHASASVRRSS